MMSNTDSTNDSPLGAGLKTCPFLGLAEDARTCFSVPDPYNLCHRVSRPQAINLNHQQSVCLTADYAKCPIFDSKDAVAFPKELREQNAERSWWAAGGWRWPALIVIILILLAGISYQAFSFSQLPVPTFTPTVEPAGAAVTATLQVLLASTPTPEPTRTLIITIPPTVTFTPSAPTPGPSPDVPFGPGGKYLIHIAQAGDSWAGLSQRFNTTSEVLKRLNPGFAQNGMWVGSPVVVMPGQRDVSGVRSLLAVQITERARVADIASQYGMQESDLRSENELGPEEWIDAGRWLIVYAKAS